MARRHLRLVAVLALAGACRSAPLNSPSAGMLRVFARYNGMAHPIEVSCDRDGPDCSAIDEIYAREFGSHAGGATMCRLSERGPAAVADSIQTTNVSALTVSLYASHCKACAPHVETSCLPISRSTPRPAYLQPQPVVTLGGIAVDSKPYLYTWELCDDATAGGGTVDVRFVGFHNLEEIGSLDCASSLLATIISDYRSGGTHAVDRSSLAAAYNTTRFFRCGLHCSSGSRFATCCGPSCPDADHGNEAAGVSTRSACKADDDIIGTFRELDGGPTSFSPSAAGRTLTCRQASNLFEHLLYGTFVGEPIACMYGRGYRYDTRQPPNWHYTDFQYATAWNDDPAYLGGYVPGTPGPYDTFLNEQFGVTTRNDAEILARMSVECDLCNCGNCVGKDEVFLDTRYGGYPLMLTNVTGSMSERYAASVAGTCANLEGMLGGSGVMCQATVSTIYDLVFRPYGGEIFDPQRCPSCGCTAPPRTPAPPPPTQVAAPTDSSQTFPGPGDGGIAEQCAEAVPELVETTLLENDLVYASSNNPTGDATNLTLRADAIKGYRAYMFRLFFAVNSTIREDVVIDASANNGRAVVQALTLASTPTLEGVYSRAFNATDRLVSERYLDADILLGDHGKIWANLGLPTVGTEARLVNPSDSAILACPRNRDGTSLDDEFRRAPGPPVIAIGVTQLETGETTLHQRIVARDCSRCSRALLGDINDNGRLDIGDMNAILQTGIGNQVFSFSPCMDMTLDGRVNIVDTLSVYASVFG